ncbi:hypothetical protein P12x_005433 [Tundrisphaera lichenicola]|uniref:hypothetical protein n=1 Tax=Tundrisphaera lichenicola TaxID=2029860 RepID=UPI003EBFA35C
MVDTARLRYPEDMTLASRSGDASSMEQYAVEAVDWVKEYAQEKPVTFALWALGIGFVLGWRLKPW